MITERVGLRRLADDPDAIARIPVEAVPDLLGELEVLRARLWARLQSANAPPVQPVPTPPAEKDRLMDVGEAADRLGVNRRWLYRRADKLPFVRRLDTGTLRFSERGLEKWKETRR